MYGIFTYIWSDFYGFHVGRYTSPMDGMGHDFMHSRRFDTIPLYISVYGISLMIRTPLKTTQDTLCQHAEG